MSIEFADHPISMPVAEFRVICLCAEWCTICREYREVFERLTKKFHPVPFVWVDVEDQADNLGDLDVENFPTALIKRQNLILYFGAINPQFWHLNRLLENFLTMTLNQCQDYVSVNQQRQNWQLANALAAL